MVHDIERRLLEGLDVQNVPVLSHSLFDGQPAHSNSIFKDCVLTDTELNCCLISKATITNTVLEGCILVNCDVLDCVLKDSHLKSSKIVESEFINSLRSKCEVRPTPYFNRIPPEVRVMIMSNAIRWNGKTPALLAAVRGDPVLYREALSTLPKVATFQLHQANEVNRKVMSQLAFQSIEKLEIK
jgi:hypothetical protein